MASETQGPFECLGSVTEKIAKKRGDASLPSSCADNLYSQAVAIVLRDRKVSTSYLQRRLGIGYNRAASLIERMEEEGIISAANYMGKREVFMALDTQGSFECLGSVTEKIAKKRGDASLPSSCADDFYSQAVAIVLRDRKVSASYLQRRLGVSYNHAASLIERMETEGVISDANYMGKREVLVSVPKEHF